MFDADTSHAALDHRSMKSLRKGLGFVIVHVGAGNHSKSKLEKYKSLCYKACKAGIEMCKSGSLASDMTREVVSILEDSHITNAGTGSNLSKDQTVECDAGLMDSLSGNYAAVGGLEGIKNPIKVAFELLKNQEVDYLGLIPPMILVGEGARKFALQRGIEEASQKEMITRNALRSFKRSVRMIKDANVAKEFENQKAGRDNNVKAIDTKENDWSWDRLIYDDESNHKLPSISYTGIYCENTDVASFSKLRKRTGPVSSCDKQHTVVDALATPNSQVEGRNHNCLSTESKSRRLKRKLHEYSHEISEELLAADEIKVEKCSDSVDCDSSEESKRHKAREQFGEEDCSIFRHASSHSCSKVVNFPSTSCDLVDLRIKKESERVEFDLNRDLDREKSCENQIHENSRKSNQNQFQGKQNIGGCSSLRCFNDNESFSSSEMKFEDDREITRKNIEEGDKMRLRLQDDERRKGFENIDGSLSLESSKAEDFDKCENLMKGSCRLEKSSKGEEGEELRLDTVGAICVDSFGNVCSGVSSGGLLLKQPGRVGQATCYGCGCFVAEDENEAETVTTASSTSGCGEQLIKTSLAKTCAEYLLNEDYDACCMLEDGFLKSRYLRNETDKMAGCINIKLTKRYQTLEHGCHEPNFRPFSSVTNSAEAASGHGYCLASGSLDLIIASTTRSFFVGYLSSSDKRPASVLLKMPDEAKVGNSVISQGFNFNW